MKSTTTKEPDSMNTKTPHAIEKFQPLDAITTFMRRFVVFTEQEQADVIALWILHTWTFDAAYATPYIYVNSAEPQSGKTRVLEVAQLLARNGYSTANLTGASMFRVIEDMAPSLFFDEVDAIFTGSANESLRGVLNSGYKTGGSATRFDGKEVVQFNTFCPKMLVGIDNAAMPDTIRDRCIPINLKRKKSGEEVERFIPRKIQEDADTLKANIEKWATQNIERIFTAADPKPIDGISDRSFEISEPLLVLARVAGGAAAEKTARAALTKLLAGKKPAVSDGIQTLMAAKELFEQTDSDRIASATLAGHMGYSPKKLGVVLAPYGITPTTMRFNTGDRSKGYMKRDFADAWERYL
jgi:hypothetical protein